MGTKLHYDVYICDEAFWILPFYIGIKYARMHKSYGKLYAEMKIVL